MRTEAHYLWDIVEAVDSIDRFMAGKSESEFQQDEMLRSAVHAKLIVIGEAVCNLSEPLLHKYPDVPWAKIRGFRNAVIHGYFKIDWDIIWGAATTEAHELRDAVEIILRQEYPGIDPEHL